MVVIPVIAPLNPYGLFGTIQGLKANLLQPTKMATDTVKTLLEHDFAQVRMREGLTQALDSAKDSEEARLITLAIQSTTGFSNDQMGRLVATAQSNVSISGHARLKERIEKYVETHGYQPPLQLPRADEYDPFADG